MLNSCSFRTLNTKFPVKVGKQCWYYIGLLFFLAQDNVDKCLHFICSVETNKQNYRRNVHSRDNLKISKPKLFVS